MFEIFPELSEKDRQTRRIILGEAGLILASLFLNGCSSQRPSSPIGSSNGAPSKDVSPPINPDSVVTFKHGVFVNMVDGLQIGLMPDNIERLFKDPYLGINNPDNFMAAVYITDLRVNNVANQKQLNDKTQQLLPYVMLRLAREQGVTSGVEVRAILSVLENLIELRALFTESEATLPADFFKNALSVRLQQDFVETYRRAVADHLGKNLPQAELTQAEQRIVSANPPFKIETLPERLKKQAGIS